MVRLWPGAWLWDQYKPGHTAVFYGMGGVGRGGALTGPVRREMATGRARACQRWKDEPGKNGGEKR